MAPKTAESGVLQPTTLVSVKLFKFPMIATEQKGEELENWPRGFVWPAPASSWTASRGLTPLLWLAPRNYYAYPPRMPARKRKKCFAKQSQTTGISLLGSCRNKVKSASQSSHKFSVRPAVQSEKEESASQCSHKLW